MQPHDHTRCSTMTLFAVFTILDGTALGKCMACHQHQEFICFLTPSRGRCRSKAVCVILAKNATYKHPEVRAWLKKHLRWTFHFTSTSAS